MICFYVLMLRYLCVFRSYMTKIRHTNTCYSYLINGISCPRFQVCIIYNLASSSTCRQSEVPEKDGDYDSPIRISNCLYQRHTSNRGNPHQIYFFALPSRAKRQKKIQNFRMSRMHNESHFWLFVVFFCANRVVSFFSMI